MQNKPVSIQPVSAAVSTAGGWTQTINDGLSSAMDLWLQYENIRKVRSSSGGDQIQKQTTPELENGAGVVVDTVTRPTANAQEVPQSSIMVNKPLFYGSLALLGLGLVLKLSK